MEAAFRNNRQATAPPKVYLVDGHELMRQGIRHMLERSSVDVIGESGGVVDAIAQIPVLRPNLVILDRRLPDGNGIDLCRDIRLIAPEIRCLVLADHNDDRALLESIRAGADGYLLKGIPGTELATAVRRITIGQTLFSPDLHQRLLARVERLSAPDQRVANLSSQERKVLALLAEGMTNRQIAQQMYLAEKTVRNYVSILLSKLGFERRTQAAIFASRSSPYGRDIAG